MEDLNDDSPMPFGTHEGKKMKDIPVSYLQWMCDNSRSFQNGWGRKVLEYCDVNAAARGIVIHKKEQNQ